MALPMSTWFASSRVAVASKLFEPSANVTIARRVHVTWSSQSLRMASWNASCLLVRTAVGCECIGMAWAIVYADVVATAWECPAPSVASA